MAQNGSPGVLSPGPGVQRGRGGGEEAVTAATKDPSPSRAVPTARELLWFYERWESRRQAMNRAIRERFGFSATRYFQLLHRALETEEAFRVAPILVARLRRLRDERRRRFARRDLSALAPDQRVLPI